MDEIRELKRAMNKSGATTADAARVLGVSWATINRWLKGDHKPSPVCRRVLRRRLDQLEEGPDE